MPVKYLAIAAVLLGVTGIATAGAGEEAATIDLSAAQGGTYFVKCSKGRDLTNCGLLSLWQQTNPVPGLQSSVLSSGDRPYDPDGKLLS